MDVYVSVEVYDGHRDGMPREERPGKGPEFLNDDIWFASADRPSEWDQRYMGYFAVLCADKGEADKVIDNCHREEGAPTLRIVWSRTPFTAEELAAIQRIVPKGPLPVIPRMTYAEFNAAAIPVNSKYVENVAKVTRDSHEAAKATAQVMVDGATNNAVRTKWQTIVDAEEAGRQKYDALYVEYSKRVLREEPATPRRAEIVTPPTVKEARSTSG